MTLHLHHTPSIRGFSLQWMRGALTALGLVITPWAAAQSATITVNSLLGAATVNGLCELSEALQAAETNAAVDGCTAGSSGADTISFAPSLFASGALPKIIDFGAGYSGNVREPMALLGPGADRLKITVSGLGNTPFTLGQFTSVLTPSFEISGITFTASSGAVCLTSSGALLYVHDVVFDACPSAIEFRTNASPSANTVTVRRTLFKNGGGSALNILAAASSPRTQVLIEQSIIRDHFGTSANALINMANGFDATFQNVEITSNAMLANALINFGNGVDNNSVSMRNVTIANNATNAVGGFATVLAQRSTFELSNSSIVNNTAFSDSRGATGGSTGGLYSIASTVNIISSVLANNTFKGVNKPGDYYKHDGASIVNIDHSLVRAPFGVTNPLLNSDTNNVPAGTNPQLGTLAYNGGFGIDGSGGYTVRSAPVLAGSPLIGAGLNPLGLINDMRGGGFPRATASGVTIGAVQEGTPTVFNFASSVASGNEGTSVVLTVNRSGSLAAAATVQCVTGFGSDTAVAGLDYTPVAATLSWAANDSTAKTCTIPLLTDALVERPEIVTVRLQNPTPLFDATTQTTSAIGLLSAVTLTINDVAPPSLVSLTVTKSGTGLGNVSSTPAGITCGATCNASFTANTVVTLTATATSGSTFTGWTGACTGTATCIVTMDTAKSVNAAFALQSFTLTVAKAGGGTGTVTTDVDGINCGSTCAAVIAFGTTVTLTATPAANATFTGWTVSTTSPASAMGAQETAKAVVSGCGATASCVVNIDAAYTVTAAFAPLALAAPALPVPTLPSWLLILLSLLMVGAVRVVVPVSAGKR